MSSLLPDEPGAALPTFESTAAAVLADRELAAARASRGAANDPLTGVRTSGHWELAVTTEGERFRRYGSPYAVVVVDLDALREVDARHGQVAAEELSELTGVMLCASVRPSDTVARLAGDKFGILAVECNRDGAAAITSRLNDAFAAAGVRASLGTAIARPGRDGISTWAAATSALFDSKAMLGSLPDIGGRFGSHATWSGSLSDD